MTKQRMLEAIEETKQKHTLQMTKIENVMAGKEIDKPTPLNKRECECGVWFYSHEKEMREVLGAQLFDKFESYHNKWHEDYRKIYDIYFKNEKKGFFSKLIGSSKIDAMTMDKAKLYYSELQIDTNELLHVIDVAKRRIHALANSKFH